MEKIKELIRNLILLVCILFVAVIVSDELETNADGKALSAVTENGETIDLTSDEIETETRTVSLGELLTLLMFFVSLVLVLLIFSE